ncbi:hypothetical protein [Paracraurococcus ruber]|nr:hypothetical protein [Paracraurococcus ruber]
MLLDPVGPCAGVAVPSRGRVPPHGGDATAMPGRLASGPAMT